MDFRKTGGIKHLEEQCWYLLTLSVKILPLNKDELIFTDELWSE